MNNNEVNNQEEVQNENKELDNQVSNQELIRNETKKIVNEDKKQKRETNFIAIIVALFFTISIAAIVYKNYVMEIEKEKQIQDRANENKNTNTSNDNPIIEDNMEEQNDEEKKKEYKITNRKTADDVKEGDANKQQEIQNKIDEKLGEVYYTIGTFSDFYYNDNYKISEINDGVKARELASYMMYNKNYSLQLTDEEKQKQYNYKISLSKLKELYEKIYGQTIEINADIFKKINYPIENKKRYDMTGTMLYCPSFDRIENDNIYFNFRCGGTSPRRYQTINYDFVEQDDIIEIYKAVAYTIEYYEDKVSYTEVYTKSDYSEEGLYDTFIKDKDGEFKLNELNKDKFNNYKITFKKNDKGNYMFEKAELIK